VIKKPGRKRIPDSQKRRNIAFCVAPKAEKFIRGLDDRNEWLESKVSLDMAYSKYEERLKNGKNIKGPKKKS
jgi:hypothetical protein